MAVTLEQTNILLKNHNLLEAQTQIVSFLLALHARALTACTPGT